MKQRSFQIKLALVFTLGILLGAVGMRGYILVEMSRLFDGGPSGVGMRNMVLKRLDRELDLSNEQHVAVERELRKIQKVLKSFEATLQPQLDKQFAESIESLRDSLTAPQVEKLQSLHDDWLG